MSVPLINKPAQLPHPLSVLHAIHLCRMGIEVNNAGTVIKAALGAKWMSAHDRHTQGAPGKAADSTPAQQ
jgi:hypothetical protein